jgi:glycosyltransferase involved in cell wall biosynthesis
VLPVVSFGDPTRNGLDIRKEGLLTFLFFGNILPYKRPDIFIEAANRVGVQANFVMAGCCKLWANYEHSITNRKTLTTYIKTIENHLIADLFCDSDFIVLPYSDTTQSGPLMLAYNYNLPVIASDLDFFKTMITDGYDGFLFPEGNIKALTEIIRKCIKLTENERLIMRKNLSETAKRYAKENDIAGNFRKFISETVNRQKSHYNL